MFTYNALQKLHQENKACLADTTSITPSSNDLINTSEHPTLHSSPVRLDLPKSSGQKICSSMQFSFQDLKDRRAKRLSLMQPSKYSCGKAKGKRFLLQ